MKHSKNFINCEENEDNLSLHDCMAEYAYLSEGVLGFELKNGFWIAPSHPSNTLNQTVRTDSSLVEYSLDRGDENDILIYVFKKNIFGQTVRTELPVSKLIDSINNGKCKLEFLYQFTDGFTRVISCELRSRKKPYHIECLMFINGASAAYYWNNLCADKPW